MKKMLSHARNVLPVAYARARGSSRTRLYIQYNLTRFAYNLALRSLQLHASALVVLIRLLRNVFVDQS